MTNKTKLRISPRKEKIFRAAAELFREKGYTASSMRDLASKVNLEVSSLYSHIRSKEEILIDICFQCAENYMTGINAIIEKNQTTVESLKEVIALHVNIALKDETSVTVFNDEWKHLSEPHLGRFLALRNDYEFKLESIIRQGIQSGQIRDLEPKLIMNTLLSSLHWLHYWKKRTVSPKKLIDQMKEIICNGLVMNENFE